MDVLHVIHQQPSFEKETSMKQNLTISLERALVVKARVISARRRTSVSRMLGDELRRIIEQDEHYHSAKQKALADLRTGFHRGEG
jgi:hypothetical protein